GQHLAVGRPGDATGHARMRPPPSRAPRTAGLPDLDDSSHTAQRQPTVGGEGDGLAPTRLRSDRAQRLAAVHFPESNRCVVSDRGQWFAVRGEDNEANAVVMADELS